MAYLPFSLLFGIVPGDKLSTMHNSNIGVDAMGVAFPEHFLTLRSLAEARGIDPAKYETGLGCVEMAVPHPAEDTVTLAAAAALAALRDGRVDPDEIGLLIVGTETAVDHAKPVASYVQGLLGISERCRVFEIKHACYGGTAGVLMAANWIASGAARGRKALVIASDIARYGVGAPGEPTQGGGAAAMVVSDNPRFLLLDHTRTGAFSRDVHDFWRPLGSPDALVDGAFSLQCYLEGVVNAYADYRSIEGARDEREFDALLLHVPFAKMAEKGHKALLEALHPGITADTVQASIRARTTPGLAVARRVGNAYTASLWLALAAAADSGAYLPGASVGMYSYGSGYCAEFFGGLLLRSGAGAVPSLRTLDDRKLIDVATYERWMAARLTPALPPLPESAFSPFVFTGSREQKRVYERLAVGI